MRVPCRPPPPGGMKQARVSEVKIRSATIRGAGRVTAEAARLRGKSGHHRAGRWGNPRRRKPTESGTERRPPPATHSPETPAVRVKGWGKSPPAPWRPGGSPNPVRCKVKQVPTTRPAEEPGTPLEPSGNRRPREMVTQDRIRLTGLLRKSPGDPGLFYRGAHGGRQGPRGSLSGFRGTRARAGEPCSCVRFVGRQADGGRGQACGRYGRRVAARQRRRRPRDVWLCAWSNNDTSAMSVASLSVGRDELAVL